jgi:hypothetical protein
MLNFPENISNPQLVDLYNRGILLLGKGEEDTLKKFRDRATAEKRLNKLQEELENMHGIAEVTEDLQWVIEKPKKNGNGNGNTPEEPRVVTRTNLPLSEPLTVLHEGNPKRANSRSFETFALYRHESVKTGENYVNLMVENGYPRKLAMSTLHWDIQHGYIRLGSEEDNAPAQETAPETPAETTAEEAPADTQAEDPVEDNGCGVEVENTSGDDDVLEESDEDDEE